jgi:hypothetical protein
LQNILATDWDLSLLVKSVSNVPQMLVELVTSQDERLHKTGHELIPKDAMISSAMFTPPAVLPAFPGPAAEVRC